MNEQRKTFIAFVKLGDFLREYCNSETLESEWHNALRETITLAGHHNGWFTEENIRFSLRGWGNLLTEEKLSAWVSKYGLGSAMLYSILP